MILNSAARMTALMCESNHIAPLLKLLQSLPIFLKLKAKVLWMPYQAPHDPAPDKPLVICC